MYTELERYVSSLDLASIPEERLKTLQLFIDNCFEILQSGEDLRLNFICTHNSRRSQLAQVWAQAAADHFGLRVSCFSGGVEVTAFNERAVASLQRAGFSVEADAESDNPRYNVYASEASKAIVAFSKLFDHPESPKDNFFAVMTCSHADENCPFIAGAKKRIPLLYEDPKAYDDTDYERAAYDERCLQIATEMFYSFSKISASL